ARPPLLGFLGIPPGLEERMTPEEQIFVAGIVRTLLTVSRQQAGLVNEAKNHDSRQRAALEQITAPTLIISTADDPFATQPGAKYTAGQIRNVQSVWPEQGGHLLVGGLEALWAAQAQFLHEPEIVYR
ncbi:MAG TPA: hypothetical protein VNK95_11970, partial [Caldilineaceae bacterium]|nr:hypothetical protein [Caldilineaceae bacterium]